MHIDLSGQIAVVTGASKGIGREIAFELARAGADLLLNARGSAALEEMATEIRALGRRVETVAADVATPDGTRQVSAGAIDRFGRVDILVNNAGKGTPKRMLELTDADWHDAIELNP